ncbi:MAG: hypothetical protein WC988_01645 [Patescibacteria group bacterium]
MIRKSRLILSLLIAFALLLTVGNMAYPFATKIVLNILWFVSLSVATIFVAMGVMAILGMKKEVGQLLEIFMEGSFSVMDLIDFIKQVFKLFWGKVKEALLNLAPLFSYILAISLYLGTLYLYKLVGKSFDVTALTVFISVAGIGLLSYINLPGRDNLTKTGWRSEFGKKVNRAFINSFEVILFVFFLTMDSTHLFYVPPDLNVPLRAQVGDYDLMLRGFKLNDAKITLIIIAVAIVIEVVRNTLKIIYSSRKYYLSWLEAEPQNNSTDKQRYQNVKKSMRLAFAESKDDLVRFISFTTALIIVFIMFPRLKLLSMATASVTLLFFDLTFPVRLLTRERSHDLISIILEKTLKI